MVFRAGCHEQMISNSFKQAFAERDKKLTMIDLRGISTNRFKSQSCPFQDCGLGLCRGLFVKIITQPLFIAPGKVKRVNIENKKYIYS
jgi:hypothetical protein